MEIDYRAEADLLADALYRILELTLHSEFEDTNETSNGWYIWAEYYNKTHQPRTAEELQADTKWINDKLTEAISKTLSGNEKPGGGCLFERGKP